MTANLDAMLKQMTDGIFAGVKSQLSPAAAENADVVGSATSAALRRLGPRVMAVSLDAYAETFSDEELTGIIAFYRTPAGRSMMTKMPRLLQTITQASVKLVPEMQAAIMEELCARQTCPQPPRSFGGAATSN